MLRVDTSNAKPGMVLAMPVVNPEATDRYLLASGFKLTAATITRMRKIGVRELVTWLEESIIDTLVEYGIKAYAKSDAPGVYVDENKIASLGLRVRRGCSFHGLAINIDMDLSPFLRINPCGYAGLTMIQTKDLAGPQTLDQAAQGHARPGP